MTSELLTTEEVAQRLKFSVAHIKNARWAGTGPAFLRLGRAVRYRPEDVEAWVAARSGQLAEAGGTQ